MVYGENQDEGSKKFDILDAAERIVASAEETTPLPPNPLPLEDRFREADEAMWTMRRKHGVSSSDYILLHADKTDPAYHELANAKAHLEKIENEGRQALLTQVRLAHEWVQAQSLPWTNPETGEPIAYHYDSQSPIDAQPLRLVVSVTKDRHNKGNYDVAIDEYEKDPLNPNNLSRIHGTTNFEYTTNADGSVFEKGYMSTGSRGLQQAQNYSQTEAGRLFYIRTNSDFRGKKSYPLGQARRAIEMLNGAQLIGQELKPGFQKRVAKVEHIDKPS